MRTRYFLSIVLLLAAVLSGQRADARQNSGNPSFAGAGTKDSTRPTQLDEVVVTGDKTAVKLSQTGKSVVVITREQLAKSGGKSLSQVLNEQAGVIVGGANSNPGSAKTIYIDGAGSGYTLILLDGMPVQDASSIDNSFDIRMITLESIERIEIVKGSQSVLYGSDAIAGIINIITRKGGDGKPFAASADGSYGTNNTWQATTDVGGTLQKFLYNAGYAYYHTDGIPEATDTVPHTANPRDGYTQNSFHGSVTWQPSKGISITPFVVYSHYTGREDAGSFSIDTSYNYTLANLQAGIRTLWNIGKGQFHLAYSYNHTNRTDYDDSLPNLASKGNFYSDKLTGYEHYVDGYISYPVGKAVNIVGGADYKNLSTAQQTFDLYPDYYTPGQVDTSASALGRDSAHYYQLGIYGAASLKLPGGLYVDGGLRYNTNSKYGSALVFNVDPSYTFFHILKAFVNISSGYKTPSLYQLYSIYGNKNLDPEKAISYEGGLQYTLPSGDFHIRGTYFVRNIHDVILFYTNPNTYQEQYINQNEETDHGVKFEAEWDLTKTLSLTANYMYVSGKTTTQTVNTHSDSSYYGLLRIPKNSVGATLAYQATPRLYLSTNVQWQDKRLDLYYDYTTGGDAPIYLHAYTLWNAYGEYRFLNKHPLRVFVDLHNITDTKYMEVYGYNTLGFTVTAGVRFSF